MAEYSFGRNILQYIQNQDELNLRAKQLETEEERYKAQQSFNQRQAQLTGARWQADYDLKVAKEISDQENAFDKENTILNAIPEDVRSQIPTEAYKYKGENIYVPKDIVDNLEQAKQRTLELEKEKNDEAQRIITNENENKRIGISAGNLQETKRYHDYLMSKTPDDGSNPDKNIAPTSVRAKLIGNVDANLEEWNRSGGFKGDNYIKWKKTATGNVSELMKASGIPINGEIVNKIRSYLTSENIKAYQSEYPDLSVGEIKEKILEDATLVYSSENPNKVNEEQLQTLSYWRKLQTK